MRRLLDFYALFVFFSLSQEPLNTNDRNCIMNDFRYLNQIAEAISTLRIVIGFLKLSFPAPELKLLTYLKKDLKLDDRVQTLNLQVPFFSTLPFSVTLHRPLFRYTPLLVLVQTDTHSLFTLRSPISQTT